MNDEIKEILDYLKDKNDYIEDFGISYKRIHIDNGNLKTLLDYITNLQQLEQEHQKINGKSRERIAYLERSNDRREDTILGLRQEINDVEDKNSKLEIALQNIQEDYDRRVKEIDVLKEENNNKAMNDYAHAIDESWYRELYDDYKSRCEKAIEYINTHKVSDTITFPLMKREQENQVKSCFDYEFEQAYKKDLLNILQNGDEEK